MELKEYLSEKKSLIEEELNKQLPDDNHYPEDLHGSMRYSVFSGGKRLRPILAIASAETIGCKEKDIITAGCALELIHAYSLIHDDLPALDNDDFRRGKLTNHKIYGEAIAILAGDALLTRAFELLCSIANKKNQDLNLHRNLIKLIEETAVAAGSMGMVGGQTVDILSEGKDISEETLRYIHAKKTGALMRVSVRTGAILADAKEKELSNLTTFAENFGLLFQITDDILNVVGDENILGKPIGTDAANKKATFPGMYGLERSKVMAEETAREAQNALADFGATAEPLRMLTNFILVRNV